MPANLRVLLVPSMLLVVQACTRPTLPSEPPIRADDAGPSPLDASTADSLSIVDGSSTVAPAGCTKDEDCNWDDPCMATRCLRAPQVAFGCDKSRPPPGTCTCKSSVCTLTYHPVPCKTTKDCSWRDNPRRPAAASDVPRPKPPVVPCSTGEWDSVCRAGFCEIVAWTC